MVGTFIAAACFSDYFDCFLRSWVPVKTSGIPEFDRAALVGPTCTSDVVPSDWPL